jgi:hypothetical protein
MTSASERDDSTRGDSLVEMLRVRLDDRACRDIVLCKRVP